jgi:hypothetical protein
MTKQKERTAVTITANAQTRVYRTRETGLTVQLSGTFAGHATAFEASVDSTDGVNGTWVPIQGIRSTNVVETATGTLGAAPAYSWEFDISGYTYFRLRATAHGSGTAVYTMQETEAGVITTQPVSGAVSISGTPAVTISGTPTVNATAVGQGAEDVAIAGNAVRVGGRVRATHQTTFVAGDAVDHTMTPAGQLLVKNGGVAETAWNASLALTTTTAQALAAAAGAGLKRHITGAQVINTGAATVELIILDGATERFRLPLPINVPVQLDFAVTHLLATANTALNANLSATGTVRINAQGYTAP